VHIGLPDSGVEVSKTITTLISLPRQQFDEKLV